MKIGSCNYRIADKKKFIWGIVTLFNIIILSWFSLSYLEIVFKNLDSIPISNYNLVVVLMEMFSK